MLANCCKTDYDSMFDARTARRQIRARIGLGNLWLRVIGRSFRGYVHPGRKIDARIRAAGFEPRAHHRGWIWQTVLYERRGTGG